MHAWLWLIVPMLVLTVLTLLVAGLETRQHQIAARWRGKEVHNPLLRGIALVAEFMRNFVLNFLGILLDMIVVLVEAIIIILDVVLMVFEPIIWAAWSLIESSLMVLGMIIPRRLTSRWPKAAQLLGHPVPNEHTVR